MPELRKTDQHTSGAPNVVPLHAAFGEPVSSKGVANSNVPNVAPAGLWNGYAEQTKPGRAKGRDKHCLANNDTCMGWATSTGFCRPHSVEDPQSTFRS